MNPNPVRLKLHRDQRELREQDLEREKLWVTAFTNRSRCGNGGDGDRGDGSSNQGCGCSLRLGGVQREPRKGCPELKYPGRQRATGGRASGSFLPEELRGRRGQVNCGLPRAAARGALIALQGVPLTLARRDATTRCPLLCHGSLHTRAQPGARRTTKWRPSDCDRAVHARPRRSGIAQTPATR